MNFNDTVHKMRVERNGSAYVAEKPKKIKKSKVRKGWSNGERYTVGGDTHVAIYQMKRDRDYFATHREGDMYRFEGWDDNRDVFDFSAYNLVWEGDLDANGNIDKVYMILQEYRPIECSRCMTSLSMSDIVLMNGSYYYVDDIGFVDITGDVNRTMKSKVKSKSSAINKNVPDAMSYLSEMQDTVLAFAADVGSMTQQEYDTLDDISMDLGKINTRLNELWGRYEERICGSKKDIHKDKDTITVTMIRNGEKENIIIPKEGDDLWADVAEYDRKNGTDFMQWDVKSIDGYDV